MAGTNYLNEGVIFLHLGAGFYSTKKQPSDTKLCKEVCKMAIDMLNRGVSAIDVAAQTLALLEDSPTTNAGIGSHLTYCGKVECDASIMEGNTMAYGAVGAVTGIKNPILVAKALLDQQMLGNIPSDDLPSSTLFDEGARLWAIDQGIESIQPEKLIVKNTKRLQQRYKKEIQQYEEYQQQMSSYFQLAEQNSLSQDNPVENEILQMDKQDTIGILCLDRHGLVVSAASSGGIALKHSGRVGQAACYGGGCWAEKEKDSSVAVATTGTGEYLMATLFAQTCGEAFLNSDNIGFELQTLIDKEFLNCRMLSHLTNKVLGVICLKYYTHTNKCNIAWAHTSKGLGIAYQVTNESRPTIQFSSLPNHLQDGEHLCLEGKIIDV